MAPKFFSSVVVRNADGKYLTMFHQRKAERQWRFAGGKVEPNEFPMVAAIRELYEELGLIPNSIKLITVTDPDVIDGDTWQGFFYLAEDFEPGMFAIREPEKIGAVEFLSADELNARGSHPEYEVVTLLEKQESDEQWNRL